MPRHLFFVLFCNECVNTRERVVKKGVSDLLISENRHYNNIWR